jgi:pSer/pThr/pTyr-binding forkhead associated (FHA) protein
MSEPALELFRESCGLCAPLFLEWENGSEAVAASTSRSFKTPFVLVGRGSRSDLVLDDETVSRRHAFLQAIAGRLFVIDLQSRTKVYWEGEEAPRSQGWFDQGGFVQIGSYRLRRSGSSASENQPGALPALEEARHPEQIEIGPAVRAALELPIRMGENPSLWPVEGPLAMVGRAEECQLALSDDSVSRFHAALVPTPLGVWVVDLLAREGVQVNGKRVRWAWLADGDTLRVGRFTFILRYETPPSQLTRSEIPLEAGLAEPPGTELAVSTKHSDHRRGAMVVRGGESAPVVRKSSQPAREPAKIVTSAAAVWEPPTPYPTDPMAMWRQQMQLMESFHNDMIMMVQMFVAMHREHLASVRHELNMVQQLTRELGALQAQTAGSPGSESAALTSGADRPHRERGPLQTSERKKQHKKPRSDQPDPVKKRTGINSAGSEGRSRDAAHGMSPRDASAPPESVRTPSEGDDQIHADLTQRIAQLQRERQGYWQKILSTING